MSDIQTRKPSFPRLDIKRQNTLRNVSISSPIEVHHTSNLSPIEANTGTFFNSFTFELPSKEKSIAELKSSIVEEGAILVCIATFKGQSSNELSIRKGEPLKMLPRAASRDWILVQPITRVCDPGWVPKDFCKKLDIQSTSRFGTPSTLTLTSASHSLSSTAKQTMHSQPRSTTLSDYCFGTAPSIQSSKASSTNHQMLTPPTTPTSISMNKFSSLNYSQVHSTERTSECSTSSSISSTSTSMMNTTALSNSTASTKVSSQFPYVSIQVTSAHNNNSRYWYKIVLSKQNSPDVCLCRYYQDFYDLQIKLLQSHSNGMNSSNPLPKLPSIISLNENIDDKLMMKRCNDLNEYINQVTGMAMSLMGNQYSILMDWLKPRPYDIKLAAESENKEQEEREQEEQESPMVQQTTPTFQGFKYAATESTSRDIFNPKPYPSFLGRDSTASSSSGRTSLSSTATTADSFTNTEGDNTNGSKTQITSGTCNAVSVTDDAPTAPLFFGSTPVLNPSGQFEKPASLNQIASSPINQSLTGNNYTYGKLIRSPTTIFDRLSSSKNSTSTDLSKQYVRFKIVHGDEMVMIRLSRDINLYYLKLSISGEIGLFDDFALSYKDPIDGLYRPLIGNDDLVSCFDSCLGNYPVKKPKIILKVVS